MVRARPSVSIPRERSQRARVHRALPDGREVPREHGIAIRRERSIEARKSSGCTGLPSE